MGAWVRFIHVSFPARFAGRRATQELMKVMAEKGAASGDGGREISLGAAVLIVAAAILLVAGIGTAIGYRFFWERNLQPPRVDMELARWEAEARRNPNSVAAWTEWGVVLYQKGQLAEAESRLKKALSLDPNADRARFFLAAVHVEQGRYDQAISELKEILKRDIRNPFVYMELSKAYEGKKDLAGALRNVDYIIEYLDPALSDVHFRRGELLEKMGRKKEAIDAYKRAASFDPEFKPARDALRRLGVKPPEPSEVLPGAPVVGFHGGRR